MTRIISGEWRGHALPVLKRGSVRPTTDRARTIMFDTLRDLRGLAVLDLYSGTGALGFEALSRGATSLVSVDRDREYVSKQKEWIEKHPAHFQVYCADVDRVLPKLKNTFDLILADPPYDEILSQNLVSWIEEHLASAGKFVYERNRRDETAIESDILQLEKQKVVAETRIQFYKAGKL